MENLKEVVEAIGAENIKDIKISLTQKGMVNLQRTIREKTQGMELLNSTVKDGESFDSHPLRGLVNQHLIVNLEVVKDE